jgi:hypothetical protein
MKYTVEMGSGAMIYIPPSFIKIGSDLQKLIGHDSHTHTEQGNCMSLLQEVG